MEYTKKKYIKRTHIHARANTQAHTHALFLLNIQTSNPTVRFRLNIQVQEIEPIIIFIDIYSFWERI